MVNEHNYTLYLKFVKYLALTNDCYKFYAKIIPYRAGHDAQRFTWGSPNHYTHKQIFLSR